MCGFVALVVSLFVWFICVTLCCGRYMLVFGGFVAAVCLRLGVLGLFVDDDFCGLLLGLLFWLLLLLIRFAVLVVGVLFCVVFGLVIEFLI